MVNSVCWTDNEYLKVYNDYYDLQLACLDIRYPPLPLLHPPPLKRGREKELRKEGKNETIKRENEQLT
jgi:hypothetical protein